MKTMLLIAMMSIGLTSCSKDEMLVPQQAMPVKATVDTVIQPVVVTTDTLAYKLDFKCQFLGVQVIALTPYKVNKILSGPPSNPNQVVGRAFYFKSAFDGGADFTIWFMYDKVRKPADVSGNYLGKSFADMTSNANGTLNMCNYAQNVPYSFTLKNSYGQTVMANN
jgi:hypothetical protein